ncbi:uncharacterized protein LOC107431174 [Ziziphus jujuba]|uniref:Uncharacterized protein LOC107431174 n=1 Tax=Ziziphus jujuba TaxID=326968 RepID=A0ABM3I3S7_ZIZJJ|nr:uncharacterized protein LOC107431174 [Ziziphus jujuba]
MVLWEIALATSYFLGLKRTHRLSLRLQRRLISPKYPKTRQFVQSRTRTVFDAVVKIQRNIQEKDKEVRQNFGNWILQWMKSSDQIQVHPLAMPSPSASSSMSWTKQQATKISSQLKTHGSIHTLRNRLSDRLQSTRLKSLWNNKPFHGIAMMMRLPTPAAVKMTQYRNLFINGPEAVRRLNYTRGGFEGGVIRRDIGQWMLQN